MYICVNYFIKLLTKNIEEKSVKLKHSSFFTGADKIRSLFHRKTDRKLKSAKIMKKVNKAEAWELLQNTGPLIWRNTLKNEAHHSKHFCYATNTK